MGDITNDKGGASLKFEGKGKAMHKFLLFRTMTFTGFPVENHCLKRRLSDSVFGNVGNSRSQ